MTQRIWCLNGNNITFDSDITMASLATLMPWVISWLEVTDSWINPWKALIKVTRAGWDEILITYENTTKVTTINTTWTKKVFIEVDQAKIDLWENNAEDGSWIAEIKTAENYPAKNFIPLADITNNVITDDRELIQIQDRFGLTKMWNDFNTAEKLVKLDETGKLPAVDWSNLTWLQADIPNATTTNPWIIQIAEANDIVSTDKAISAKDAYDKYNINVRPSIISKVDFEISNSHIQNSPLSKSWWTEWDFAVISFRPYTWLKDFYPPSIMNIYRENTFLSPSYNFFQLWFQWNNNNMNFYVDWNNVKIFYQGSTNGNTYLWVGNIMFYKY
jgi:hypothetical protein